MGLRLKICADCGHRKMIGRSKRRCKACRRAGPQKQIPMSPRKSNKKKKVSKKQGLFDNQSRQKAEKFRVKVLWL